MSSKNEKIHYSAGFFQSFFFNTIREFINNLLFFYEEVYFGRSLPKPCKYFF